MAEIDTLVDAKALRCWATQEKMADVISRMVKQAIEQDISPQNITIVTGIDFQATGEYEIILWGD